MDRSDPEAMAAERHQDRLDDDADAMDYGAWGAAVHAPDGTKLAGLDADREDEVHGWLVAHADAAAPAGGDTVARWEAFADELGDLEYDPRARATELVAPDGCTYRILAPIM